MLIERNKFRQYFSYTIYVVISASFKRYRVFHCFQYVLKTILETKLLMVSMDVFYKRILYVNKQPYSYLRE